MSTLNTKPELRCRLRKLRNSFSPFKRARAAHLLSLNLLSCNFFSKQNRLAFYLANDGEIETDVSIHLARKKGSKIYLPVVKEDQHLSFNRFGVLSRLSDNKYGIKEARGAEIPLGYLDVIFMPLVGFDRLGQRLGMGGGYYDRTLEKLQHAPQRPLLVGLAYQQQKLRHLETDAWDIRLDCIVTEKEVLFVGA